MEDRLLSEVTSMRLRRPAAAPAGRIWMVLALGGLRPEWRPYLHLSEQEKGLVADLSA